MAGKAILVLTWVIVMINNLYGSTSKYQSGKGNNNPTWVFFHIPRTGGSSIWHNLVQHADTRLCAYDLWFEAAKSSGNPLFGREKLRMDLPRLEQPLEYPLCIHHHLPIGVADLLPNARFFTYLRDPLDRFVSHIAWNLLMTIKREREVAPPEYTVDIEANYVKCHPLLLLCHPRYKYLRFYYWNMIWGLMGKLHWGNYGTNYNFVIEYLPTFDATQKEQILDFVAKRFAFLGFDYEGKAPFIQKIEDSLGLPTGALDVDYVLPATVGEYRHKELILQDKALLEQIRNELAPEYEFYEKVWALFGKGSK
jgi:hypothetical protein